MLAQATCRPPDLSAQTVLVGADKGRLQLKTTVSNRSGRALDAVSVDFRMPVPGKRPMMNMGDGLVNRPFAELGAVADGKGAEAVFATVHDVKTPLESVLVRAYLKSGDGTEGASDAWLWYVPAPLAAAAPKIDGELNEWTTRQPAWLHYNWATALMNRHYFQIYEGGEHFNYPPYRVDERVAFWTRWDKENLYVAVRIQDDELVLQGALAETLTLVLSRGAATHRVTLLPRNRGNVVVEGVEGATAVCRKTSSRQRNGADARLQNVPVLEMEVALPWQALAIQPEAGTMLGFDLLVTDADREEGTLVAGTLRWAGGADATGFTLLLP
jgi:hypothetical protein